MISKTDSTSRIYSTQNMLVKGYTSARCVTIGDEVTPSREWEGDFGIRLQRSVHGHATCRHVGQNPPEDFAARYRLRARAVRSDRDRRTVISCIFPSSFCGANPSAY